MEKWSMMALQYKLFLFGVKRHKIPNFYFEITVFPVLRHALDIPIYYIYSGLAVYWIWRTTGNTKISM